MHRHGVAADVHEQVADRFVAEELTPVLDVGCGEGELARSLPEGAWIGADRSAVLLAEAPRPAVLADATALPFGDAAFPAVAILYVLYHLPDPALAITEAHRVLRPEGLLAVAVPSAHDSPELAHLLPSTPLTFDAELAPGMLQPWFAKIEVIRWDVPLIRLPSHDAVGDYLIGKGVAVAQARATQASVEVPLDVTKRGALLFARKLSGR